MAFPSPPYTNGQTFTENGVSYTFNTAAGVWKRVITPVVAAPTNTVTGSMSLTGGGDLSTNRTLSLLNDNANPGIEKIYGTDASGVKGWRDGPKTFSMFQASLDSTQSIAVGKWFSVNNGYELVGNGIAVGSNDTTNGLLLNLTLGRQYVINFVVNPPNASFLSQTYGLFNGTTGASIAAQFSGIGRISMIYNAASVTALKFGILAGATLTGHSGTLSIYTCD